VDFDIKIIDQYINTFLEFFEHLGVLGALLMPFFEAVFPFLPLVAIAGINIQNFGFLGFVYTYIGSVVGTLCVFCFVRKFFGYRLQSSQFIKTHPGLNKFLVWVDTKGFTSIMLLLAVPFTPTSLINYACALSKMSFRKFAVIAVVARLVCIGFLSYIGNSIFNIIDHPINAVVAMLMALALYIISKILERRINKTEAEKKKLLTEEKKKGR
jgi:uncharacterized membrane protein YdjX (TVP38/TMEM64 family)